MSGATPTKTPILFRPQVSMPKLTQEDPQLKVIVILDIDDTIMNFKATNAAGQYLHATDCWHISAEKWVSTLETLKKQVESTGLQFHIAIVTSKPGCDDLVIEVIRQFENLMPANWHSPLLPPDDIDYLRICGHVVDDTTTYKGYFTLS